METTAFNRSKQTVVNALHQAFLIVALITIPTFSAEAITVGGQEYEKILSLYTGSDDFGFWSRADKFFTFINNDNYIKPNRVSKTTFKDPKLEPTVFSQIQAMGTTSVDNHTVTSGVVDVYGPNSHLLFSATYLSNGTQSHILRSGTSGQLDVNGVFQVTAGSLFDQGLVTGQLYLEIAYDRVWKNSSIDLKTSNGTWTFYELVDNPTNPPEPPTEVPEPISMSLLLSGLLGASQLKSRKEQNSSV